MGAPDGRQGLLEPGAVASRPAVDAASWGLDEGDEIVPGRIALQRLGGGELYETYLAWDSRLFAVIVVKALRPDVLSEDWARRRLEFEAELIERLDHPVIVRGFGAVLDGPRPHLVLEHLDGPTLRSLIGRQREGPLDEVLPLALHMCSALHYLAIEEASSIRHEYADGEVVAMAGGTPEHAALSAAVVTLLGGQLRAVHASVHIAWRG